MVCSDHSIKVQFYVNYQFTYLFYFSGQLFIFIDKSLILIFVFFWHSSIGVVFWFRFVVRIPNHFDHLKCTFLIHLPHDQSPLFLTFGTNIKAMERKQQKITDNATKAKLASCCEAVTIITGAVIKHVTTTL